MKHIVGYCRVSSDEQRMFGSSIENQKDRMKAYCQYKQYPEPIFICDEGISGKKMINRPGLQTLIKMVQNNEVERIIIYSLSRLSRDTIETMLFIKDLNKREIPIHSLTEELNTSTAVGRFYLLMSAGLAELESAQIGERTSSVLQNRKSQKQVYCKSITGFSKQDGQLVENEHIETVSKIISLNRNGKGAYAISTILNKQGVKSVGGGKFYQSSIIKILNNPIYKQVNA